MTVMIGSPDDFDALIYGTPHPGTLNYLHGHMERLGNQISQFGDAVTEAGRQFWEKSQSMFQRFNSDDALRFAEAAIRRVQAAFQPEVVRPLYQLADIQNASLTMQRWIMANPTVREYYHTQRCDGFSESYVDMEPGARGAMQYDYRRVMNGLVVDDPQTDWKATIYFDDLHQGDRELTLPEKLDIKSTWQMVEALIQQGGDDPTSPFGGKL